MLVRMEEALKKEKKVKGRATEECGLPKRQLRGLNVVQLNFMNLH